MGQENSPQDQKVSVAIHLTETDLTITRVEVFITVLPLHLGNAHGVT